MVWNSAELYKRNIAFWLFSKRVAFLAAFSAFCAHFCIVDTILLQSSFVSACM